MKNTVVAQQSNNGERKQRDTGINRLNDRKEQCCDSEQLAFPSGDRQSLVRVGVVVSVCVCVCARAHLIETDCLVIVHF